MEIKAQIKKIDSKQLVSSDASVRVLIELSNPTVETLDNLNSLFLSDKNKSFELNLKIEE